MKMKFRHERIMNFWLLSAIL